jgi:hypothetical protein
MPVTYSPTSNASQPRASNRRGRGTVRDGVSRQRPPTRALRSERAWSHATPELQGEDRAREPAVVLEELAPTVSKLGQLLSTRAHKFSPDSAEPVWQQIRCQPRRANDMTLGADLERDRLNRRARRVTAVIAELRRQAKGQPSEANVGHRHLHQAISEFEAEVAEINTRLGDLASRAASAPSSRDPGRDWPAAR